LGGRETRHARSRVSFLPLVAVLVVVLVALSLSFFLSLSLSRDYFRRRFLASREKRETDAEPRL
jgi:flagellar basal body-associated protein FliL